ncbi:MAG: NUDIX domain-containing protein [Enhygromyxa sp.]
MASKQSAGLLLCRPGLGGLEFLLVHPGGPFFANKDAGAWTIPKGLIDPGEEPLATARREFVEETGFTLPPGPFAPLGFVDQKGGKRVFAWVALGDADPAALRSNSFTIEWPPRSGLRRSFPEVDRAQWFDLASARAKILAAQVPLLERASQLLQPLLPQ